MYQPKHLLTKELKKIVFILCGLSLMINLHTLKASATSAQNHTCLESREGDSKSFGISLAVDGDYLAVGDPEANRVVIYNRGADGNWQRIREINPPRSSLAKKRGYGFGYELAINNNILAIRSYDYKRSLESRYVPNYQQTLGFETHSTSLENSKISSLKKIKLPTLRDLPKSKIPDPQSFSRNFQNFTNRLLNRNFIELFVDSLEFLGNDIVFFGKLKVSDEEYIIHLFLVNPITGEITNKIKGLDIKSYYENPNYDFSCPVNHLEIASDNDSLLIPVNPIISKEYWGYLVTESQDIEEITLDQKAFEPLPPFENIRSFLSKVEISNNLIVTVVKSPPVMSGNIMLWQRYPRPSLVDVVDQHGLIDVQHSFVLISVFPKSKMRSGITSDYVFIQIDENKITTQSKIRWERPIGDELYSYIGANGLIDSSSLLLSAYGTVVALPIENLPSSYEIKNPHCRS